MKPILITLALIFSAAVAAQNPQSPDFPKNMKQYFIGFLVKGEKWAQTPPKEQQDLLIRKHLAYVRSQAEAGKYSLAGPFMDDGRIGGILIINAATAEEARQIASGDPMVQSGRMAVEIHPAMLADLSCVQMEYGKTPK